MSTNECTIRWRNKPIDKLSIDEMRHALVEALDHTMQSGREDSSLQSFYPAFLGGMLAGGFFCFVAVAMMFGIGG